MDWQTLCAAVGIAVSMYAVAWQTWKSSQSVRRLASDLDELAAATRNLGARSLETLQSHQQALQQFEARFTAFDTAGRFFGSFKAGDIVSIGGQCYRLEINPHRLVHVGSMTEHMVAPEVTPPRRPMRRIDLNLPVEAEEPASSLPHEDLVVSNLSHDELHDRLIR